jgi:hypothetical protein
MSRKFIVVTTAIAALSWLAAQPASADPMKCSGEHKTCIAACKKGVNPALVGACITDCHSRQTTCRQTGCWNNGTNRYCGLLRQ